MEKSLASPMAGLAPEGVAAKVCQALGEKERVRVNFGSARLFEQCIAELADDASVTVVALGRERELVPWHERLLRVGLPSEVVSARSPPPRVRSGVVWVTADWLASEDHQAWCRNHGQRVLVRSDALTPPSGIAMAKVWCPGDGATEFADVALGFSQPRKFSVITVAGGVARARVVAKNAEGAWLGYRGGRLSAGSQRWAGNDWAGLSGAGKTRLVCSQTPASLEELAALLDESGAEECSVLFGPDDLLALREASLFVAHDSVSHVSLFDWLSGDFCRTRIFAAAFGEACSDCGICDVCMSVAAKSVAAKTAEPAPLEMLRAEDAPLFEAFRDWRWKIARDRDLPPYVIFSNAVLAALARTRPQDEQAFLAVKGCGPRKWQDFGKEVLALIQAA